MGKCRNLKKFLEICPRFGTAVLDEHLHNPLGSCCRHDGAAVCMTERFSASEAAYYQFNTQWR